MNEAIAICDRKYTVDIEAATMKMDSMRDSMEVLSQRVFSLIGAQSKAASRLKALEQSRGDCMVTSFEDTVNRISSDMDSVASRVDKLEGDDSVSSLSNRFRQLEAIVEQMGSRAAIGICKDTQAGAAGSDHSQHQDDHVLKSGMAGWHSCLANPELSYVTSPSRAHGELVIIHDPGHHLHLEVGTVVGHMWKEKYQEYAFQVSLHGKEK